MRISRLARCGKRTASPNRAWIQLAGYLDRYGLEEAIDRMRAGIKAYNAANDVPEGSKSGYNETTTQAFVRIIHATMVAYAGVFPTDGADSFCDTPPHLMSKFVLRLFYSPDRRMHPDAKTRFVPPDLAPLPVPSGAAR